LIFLGTQLRRRYIEDTVRDAYIVQHNKIDPFEIDSRDAIDEIRVFGGRR
jgi:hypothetical protein